MKARLVSLSLGILVLSSLLLEALCLPVEAATAPEAAAPAVYQPAKGTPREDGIDDEDIDWDLDMTGEGPRVGTQAAPTPGADTAGLPLDRAAQVAALPAAGAQNTPALEYRDGAYHMAPGTAAEGGVSTQGESIIDMSSVRLVLPDSSKTALVIEGMQGVTIQGLTIDFSPDAEVPKTPAPEEEAPPPEEPASEPPPEEEAPPPSESTPPAEEPPAETSSQPEAPAESQAESLPAETAEDASLSTQESTEAMGLSLDAADPAQQEEDIPPAGDTQPEEPASSLPQPEAPPQEDPAPPSSETTPSAETAPEGDEAAPASEVPERDEAAPAQEEPEAAQPVLRIEGCKDITLKDVTILQGEGTGVEVAAGNEGVMLDGLVLENVAGTGVHFAEGVQRPALENSVVAAGGPALLDESETGGYLRGNLLQGEVQVSATGAQLWHNTLENGTLDAQNSRALLLAYNETKNAAVQLEGCQLVSVVHNTFPAGSEVVFSDTSDLTLADNDFNGPVRLHNVQNALVTDNTLNGQDGVQPAMVTQSGTTTGVYGSNVAAYTPNSTPGANTALLPSIDINKFNGWTRKSTITVGIQEIDVVTHIADQLKTTGQVIIPTGAYTLFQLNLKSLANASISAYEVLFEFDNSGPDFGNRDIIFGSCTNVSVRGLTISHDVIPYGQGTVQSVQADGGVVVLPDTGYLQDWTDGTYFPGGTRMAEGFRKGSTRPYCDIGFTNIRKSGKNMICTGASTGLRAGDKVVLRANYVNVNYFGTCSGMLYEDVTVFSGAGFAFYEWGGEGGLRLNRVAVTPGPAPTGGPARLVSSCDAVHSTGVRKGPHISNSLFDKMTDDGANINSVYKVATGYDAANRILYFTNPSLKLDFRPGDHLMVFTTEGKMLCEVNVPAASWEAGGVTAVQLPAGVSLAFEAGRTLVENASANGAGFLYENNVVQDNRSRGIVVKAPSGTIRNCTFRGTGMAGIQVKPEITDGWGESGFVRGLTIQSNLLSENGYFGDREINTPINLSTDIGAQKSAAYQSQINIVVTGNSVQSRYTRMALHANNVQHLTVTGNSFGARVDGANTPAIKLEGVTSTNISGNGYAGNSNPFIYIDGNTCKSIGGSDIRKNQYFYTTEKLVLNMKAKTLAKKGKTVTLKPTFTPTAAKSYIKVKWKSSNKKVAKVNTKGKVTAVKPGKATITATTADGKKATCKITVGGTPVSSVKLNKTKYTLYLNKNKNRKTYTLKATLKPAKPTNKKVTWTSSNAKVAKVNTKGKVTAVGKGTCTITVTSQDGSKKRTCKITVK